MNNARGPASQSQAASSPPECGVPVDEEDTRELFRIQGNYCNHRSERHISAPSPRANVSAEVYRAMIT
jgi:hypothetical protein